VDFDPELVGRAVVVVVLVVVVLVVVVLVVVVMQPRAWEIVARES
jgi:hypothetical protein